MRNGADQRALRQLVGPLGPGGAVAIGGAHGSWGGVVAPISHGGAWDEPGFEGCEAALGVTPLSATYLKLLASDPRRCLAEHRGALAQASMARLLSTIAARHPELRPPEPSVTPSLVGLLEVCFRTHEAALDALYAKERQGMLRLLSIEDDDPWRRLPPTTHGGATQWGGSGGGKSSSLCQPGLGFEDTWRSDASHAAHRRQVLLARADRAQLALKNLLLRFNKPLSASDMETEWPQGSAKGGLAMAHWGGASGLDPGVKAAARVDAKATAEHGGDVRKVLDTSRLRLSFETCEGLLAGLDALARSAEEEGGGPGGGGGGGGGEGAGSGLTILAVRNRFRRPSCLGWRDLTLYVGVTLPSEGGGGGGGGGDGG